MDKKVIIIMVLGILLGLYVIISYGMFQEAQNKTYNTLEEQMCHNLKGTPSWATSDGIIFDSGYKELLPMSYNPVENLIKEKVYYLYDSACVWCQKQQLAFDETWNGSWQQYIDSGYAINCREVLFGGKVK